MDKEQQDLKAVSDATKKHIQGLELVTPTLFKSVFESFAKAYDINSDRQDLVASESMQEQIEQYININTHSSEQAKHLSESAHKAVDAIEKQDKRLLQSVLDEVQSLRQEIDELKDSVYQDALTKVFNRKWLDDHCLEDEGDHFAVSGVMAILDMNHFKHINDTYGHIIGDKVLVFVASQLRQLGSDVIRYGGDEFMIVFPEGTTLRNAEQLLHNRRELVLKKNLQSGDERFKISFSYGCVPFSKGDKFETIVHQADSKMYDDKIKIKARLADLDIA